MVLSVILCVIILLIFTGVLFFMETEGGWIFSAVFSGDEKDVHTAKPDAQVARKGSFTAIVHSSDEKFQTETEYKNMADCTVLTDAYTLIPSGNAPVCCGYGSCTKKCPQEAIIISKGKAVIGETCNGCGLCIAACPLHLITLVPQTEIAEKKRSFWFKFWKFWYTILKRDEADGSIALWE